MIDNPEVGQTVAVHGVVTQPVKEGAIIRIGDQSLRYYDSKDLRPVSCPQDAAIVEAAEALAAENEARPTAGRTDALSRLIRAVRARQAVTSNVEVPLEDRIQKIIYKTGVGSDQAGEYARDILAAINEESNHAKA